jgi:hypothetical protein
MPKQAPGAAQDEISAVGSEAGLRGTRTTQPVSSITRIAPRTCLRVLAGEAGDAEDEEGKHRAEPPDRGRDVGGEGELAQAMSRT